MEAKVSSFKAALGTALGNHNFVTKRNHRVHERAAGSNTCRSARKRCFKEGRKKKAKDEEKKLVPSSMSLTSACVDKRNHENHTIVQDIY